MGALLWFRTVVYSIVSLFAVVVLGLCGYFTSLVPPHYDSHDPTVVSIYLGLATAVLTLALLPAFLLLGRVLPGLFLFTIVSEVVWAFLLTVLWAATAGEVVAIWGRMFPGGCLAYDIPVCSEFSAIAAFSFLNFIALLAYGAILIIYASVSSARGKGIWTSSVQAVSPPTPSPVSGVPGTVPVTQYPVSGAPGPFYNYPGHPAGTPPANFPPHPQYGSYYGPPSMPGQPQYSYPGYAPGSSTPNMFHQQPGYYPGYPPQNAQPPSSAAQGSPQPTPSQDEVQVRPTESQKQVPTSSDHQVLSTEVQDHSAPV
ncbi:hypothetical protein BV22DRAFT_1029048 [Leucogyrophana mollusca]|uniref:Uncharacterized protein n=1 Tax=Leucogyrophana mollusca TaxID=85980 RepID=A0ACB8BV86_9AGAM|nr:hypothetical protein BV22DRAFT_1029048 [Leucogyrophana mollusca]